MIGVLIYVQARYSDGNGKAGLQYVYLRPNFECMNRSRRVGAFCQTELLEKAEKIIKKWYAPGVILYEIDGYIIGSNNPENALREYWRVCDPAKMKQRFEVNPI